MPVVHIRENRDHSQPWWVGDPVSDDNQPRGIFIGACGHRVPVSADGYLGECPCDARCVYCGDISEVQRITGASPRVQAWLCSECDTRWATTTVNPQLHLDRLATTVKQLNTAKALLRQVITLADDADALSDLELRARLLALAGDAQ